MEDRAYFVYIMSNKHNTVIYTGITNNLLRRIYEHKSQRGDNFSSRYNCSKLVYFEHGVDVETAIKREKQIKRWRRAKKVQLIEKTNPGWRDLVNDWF